MLHVLVDCSTGQEVHLTHEEAIAHPAVGVDENFEQMRTESFASQQTAERQRDADLVIIKAKAKTDPAFAALVRLQGISLD